MSNRPRRSEPTNGPALRRPGSQSSRSGCDGSPTRGTPATASSSSGGPPLTDDPRGPPWRVLLAVVLGGLAVAAAAFVWAAAGQSHLADRADEADRRAEQ